MTDLDKLIAAVGAGKLPTFRETVRAVRGADAVDVDMAFGGSLDAAKRLHDALLPEWGWEVWRVNATDYACNLSAQETSFSTDPARAWLLGILKALKAKGEA